MGEAIITRRVSVGVSGAELLADIEVTSAVTQVDITGLNITSDDEILLVSDVVTNLGAIAPRLYVNGNYTATNYYAQNLSVDNTSISAARVNYPYLMYGNANRNVFNNTRIKLTEGGYFTYQSSSCSDYLIAIFMAEYYGTSTFTMSTITNLRIDGNGNQFGIGSRFQLYKLGGA